MSHVVRGFSTGAEVENRSLSRDLKNPIRVSTGAKGSQKRLGKTLRGEAEKHKQGREESGTWETAKCREKSE